MKTAGLRKGIALFLAVVMMLGIGGMSVPTAQAAEYPDRGNAGGKAGNRYYTGPDLSLIHIWKPSARDCDSRVELA